MRDPSSKIRVAAVGDLHCREHDHGRFRQMVKQINEAAELVLLCGDLTDHGTEKEGAILAEELSTLSKPCVAVLGNHDLEHGRGETIVEQLSKVGVHCLDGDIYVFEKTLAVAGVKGFGGGFGRATLQAFGEEQTKAFVQEAIREVLKLEQALGKVKTPKSAVVLHYSPVLATLEGENPELRPFLGTSRLVQPIDEYEPQVVFHGHAHYGSPRGQTGKGIPVFNVAMPLIERLNPERRFFVYEL